MIRFVCANCGRELPLPKAFDQLPQPIDVARFNHGYCPSCGHMLNPNPEPRYLR